MRTYITLAIIAGAFGYAACKKKPPETVPVPKAEQTAQAAAAVSTAPAAGRDLLAAPGVYLKTTVGQVQNAKAFKTLYEKAAKDRLNSMDPGNTGGN